MKASAVTTEFRSWVGTPWVHQGRTRHGIDCGGLMVKALGGLGLLPDDFDDPQAYGREPQETLLRIVESVCGATPVRPVPEGSIIAIRWARSQFASHLAYCTGRNLIHAYSRVVGPRGSGRQNGRVIEHRYGEPWLRQTVGVYSIPGVTRE